MTALTEQLAQQQWDEDDDIGKFFANQAVYFRDLSDQLDTIIDETAEFEVN